MRGIWRGCLAGAAGLAAATGTANAAGTQAKSNPADCADPVCGSKSDALRKSLFGGAAGPSRGPTLSAECPVDREQLGQHTWALLHTVAAYFPEQPSDADCEHARRLVHGLAQLYPCAHCAEDFREEVAKSPPRVESRAAFCTWVCEQHNLVNAKLGKPAFVCDQKLLAERWRVGGAHCDVERLGDIDD